MAHLSFRRLDDGVPAPTRAHAGDAGVDLRTTMAANVPPGGRVALPTGLAVEIPPGYAGLVLPRSGHARRHGIGLVNAPGLIDSGYRGEIEVLVVNHGSEEVSFERGERIAQLVVIAIPEWEWVEVDELSDSARGSDGFGSTGR